MVLLFSSLLHNKSAPFSFIFVINSLLILAHGTLQGDGVKGKREMENKRGGGNW